MTAALAPESRASGIHLTPAARPWLYAWADSVWPPASRPTGEEAERASQICAMAERLEERATILPEAPRDTDPDPRPWLCPAGEATTRADVAPLCLMGPVVSAVAGEP